MTDLPVVRTKTVDYGEKQLIRIATPYMDDEKNTVDVNYDVIVIDEKDNTVSKLNEVHKMRYFFYPEIEFMLESVGFKLVAHVDCKSLGGTDYSSWTCYWIAEAI